VTDEELTLEIVRQRAQARMKGICSVNKVCDGNPNRMCQGQKYGRPIGFGGAGKGLGFTANIAALDRIYLRPRLVREHAEPDMGLEMFGRSVQIPIMASSLSGVKASMGGSVGEREFAESVLGGCADAGTIGFIGNTADEGQELAGVQAVRAVGTGIPIFKPQSNKRLLELIKMAEDAGATAVGVDLDGVGSTNWERAGKPLYRKSASDLRELVDSTELPFVAKGILSAEDALDASDAGVKFIDVSNHGARSLDSTRGVAEVLPLIARDVGDRMTVTAGGGVRTGFDVLKMLALGAKAVLVGRDIARAAIGGNRDGVRLHLEYLRDDLRRAMIMTGCDALGDIDGRVIEY
jgi:4-hydroxymandelate oxidase